MNISTLLVAGTLTIGISTVGSPAEEVAHRSHLLQIISVIEDASITPGAIGHICHASAVRLVSLDGLFAGKYRRALVSALARKGAGQVDALKAVIIENRLLIAELHGQRLNHQSIVAIDISASGRIAVDTFGAWA